MKFRALAGLIVVPVLLAACGGIGSPSAKKPAAASEVDTRLVEGNTRFAVDLLRALHKEKPEENLFISPTSVSLALSMTYNGAQGETQQAMARALSLDGLTPAEVNQGNGALQSILANPDPKVELRIANALWYKKGYKVNPTFLQTSRTHYGAEVEAADFGAPDAEKPINRWVDKATKGKIPTILNRTSPNDRMYLVNAIYFYGSWEKPFDASLTEPRPFTPASGAVKQLPMMAQHGHYRYLQGEGFQAVALPYGEGRVSMYLFLPEAGLEPFVAGLTAEQLTTWLDQLQRKVGSLVLPKVKLSYQAELSSVMEGLGMGIAFTDQADFGALFEGTQERLAISGILHKTFLEMNEKGTEAAAVTAVGVTATSAPAPTERFTMVVDRPYLIAIRDDQTGTLLFVGAIADPE